MCMCIYALLAKTLIMLGGKFFFAKHQKHKKDPYPVFFGHPDLDPDPYF